MIKNVKNTVRGDMLLVIVKTNKLLERFTKKKCKKQIKNNLGQKASKIKDDELHVKSKKKKIIILLADGLITKTQYR